MFAYDTRMLWFLLCAMLAPPTESLSVLIYSKTAPYHGRDFEYRHEAIAEGTAAIRAIGAREGWTVEATEDASRFNDETLARFDVVVFLLTTGDVLGVKEQAAFERFIRSGKGYVGIHSASDTEHAWPWYGELVGAYFKDHPTIQEATYIVEDRSHPATKDLSERWTRTDEHYNFQTNPRPNVHVLMTLDESSYDVGDGAMGDHPIAWYHDYDGGRAFYTALGHVKDSYDDLLFLGHLEGGITWAGSKEP
ncbi:MAG: hypothetical protein BMS9Abin37_1082 [Acidobacteriota bacterium]|nr:MAG: hypothetical protein BMS9Abin37_1082 [Acidobacteriota bacterium]